MIETFFIRKIGGPDPGTIEVRGEWPLPSKIDVEGGFYEKVSESQITNEQAAQMDLTHIKRAALYHWRQTEGFKG